jgi:UDP-glucose 4-epimerase
MKILIIGGAGFIGFHLAKKLSKSHAVYLIDDLSRGKLDKELNNLIEEKRIKLIKKDITKKNVKLPNNFDYIFNFAAIVGVQNVSSNPSQVLEKNVLLQIESLKIAKLQKNLKKFVFSSTSEVYSGSLNKNLLKFPTPENNILCLNDLDNPRHTYMLSKIYGEALCNFANIPFLIIRLHNIYGPRMGMQHVIPQWISRILQSKKKHTYYVENANHSRTFCFIDDAIEMIEEACFSRAKNLTLNIGNSKPEIRIIDLIKVIFKVFGISKYKLIPKKIINFSPTRRAPNMKKFKSKFKYRSNFSLENGIKKTLLWHKKKHQ